jgi:hypothetical protein
VSDEEGPTDGSSVEGRDDRFSDLRPAAVDDGTPEARSSYLPKVPWRWVFIGIALVGVLVGGYVYREKVRGDSLRGEIITAHQHNLTDLSHRYMDFRHRIERWVVQSADAGEPRHYVDPRLNLAGLRAGEGLYLRLPVTHADSSDHVTAAALTMQPDAITRCMGIAPVSARGLYERGDFLTPEWMEELRNERDVTRLRVIDDQLRRHVQVDVPVITTLMRSDWFMLVIQQGENRRDHPVDVYLWDLHENRQLMRTRIQGRGLLVPVRVRFPGIEPAPLPAHQNLTSGGAHDCSIASQIRALTGNDPVDFDSAQQVLDAAQHVGEEPTDEAAAPEGSPPEGSPPEGSPPEGSPPEGSPSEAAPSHAAPPAER